jgi:NADH dehydrogenase
MIFLTGSTGFVGRNLLPSLKKRGDRVRCFIRQSSKTEGLNDNCEDKVIGDVLDESSLRYSMRGADTVIHLAGVRMETGSQTFEGTFYLGTRHVVDVAKSVGVKRLILFSTYGARPQAASRYLHYKWLAEEYLRHSGLKFVILRPTIIYGPRDHFVTRWIKKIRSLPIVPILGSGDNLLQPISVADIVQCVLKVLEDPSKNGLVYELGGPDRLSFERIVRLIGKVIGHRRALFHWPLALVKPFAYLCQMFIRHPPFTTDELSRWMEDRVCDHEIIERDFGFKLTPFGEGLRQYFSDHH